MGRELQSMLPLGALRETPVPPVSCPDPEIARPDAVDVMLSLPPLPAKMVPSWRRPGEVRQTSPPAEALTVPAALTESGLLALPTEPVAVRVTFWGVMVPAPLTAEMLWPG